MRDWLSRLKKLLIRTMIWIPLRTFSSSMSTDKVYCIMSSKEKVVWLKNLTNQDWLRLFIFISLTLLQFTF